MIPSMLFRLLFKHFDIMFDLLDAYDRYGATELSTRLRTDLDFLAASWKRLQIYQAGDDVSHTVKRTGSGTWLSRNGR